MTQTTTPPSIAEFADIVDTDEATWAYLNALNDDELRKELFPHARFRMLNLQRARVRVVEERVFGGDGDGSGAPRMPVDLLADRYELVDKGFSLPDGTRVTWGDATPEQHDLRAARQRRLAGTCIADAERHERVAALIRAHGVTCWREVPEEA